MVALPAASPQSRASRAFSEPGLAPLHRVFFDERRSAARAFATRAGTLGLQTLGFDGDVTDLWYGDLDLRWREAPCAIAGMTGEGALFCLERLAWDRGLRVVSRVRHLRLEGGMVEHVLRTSRRALDGFRMRCVADSWEPAVAALVATADGGSVARRDATVVSAPGTAQERWPEPLVSWVIAPAPSRARASVARA